MSDIRLRDDPDAVAEVLEWLAGMVRARKLDRFDMLWLSGEVSRLSLSDGPEKSWRLPGVAVEEDEQ